MRATHFSREMKALLRRHSAAVQPELGRQLQARRLLHRIDEDGRYLSPSIADAVATLFSTQMTQLTGNAAGAVQSLPNVNVVSGKQRQFIANLTLAAQASGSVIAMARIPLPAVLTGITLITDTSLGSTTIAFGDANSGAIYAAAQTFTTLNTPTRIGLAATHGAPITSGYDAQSGALVSAYAPGQGGAVYEDILMTTAAATAPASGNFVVIFEYSID